MKGDQKIPNIRIDGTEVSSNLNVFVGPILTNHGMVVKGFALMKNNGIKFQ